MFLLSLAYEYHINFRIIQKERPLEFLLGLNLTNKLN